jgi:hypothetical protein
MPQHIASAIQAPKTPAPGNNPVVTSKPSPHPGDHEFETIPQSDGTLLLRLKNGPILKIISGIKIPGAEDSGK